MNPTTRTTPPPFSPEDLASVIADDTGSPLFVFTQGGELLHANRSAATIFEGDTASSATLQDALPKELGDDLRAATAELSARPVALQGMIAGRWTTLTLRPVTFDDQPAILAIASTQPSAHTNANAPDTRATSHTDLGEFDQLTPRELEIVRLVGLGAGTGEIAEGLGRSVKTVDGHLLSIRAKLGPRSRAQLARLAIRSGITELSEDRVRRLRPRRRPSRNNSTTN